MDSCIGLADNVDRRKPAQGAQRDASSQSYLKLIHLFCQSLHIVNSTNKGIEERGKELEELSL